MTAAENQSEMERCSVILGKSGEVLDRGVLVV